MNSRLLAFLCVCLAAPMATGLKCYTCVGVTISGTAQDCVDGTDGKLTSITCSGAPTGQEAVCQKQGGKASVNDVTSLYVTRGCANVPTSTEKTCTELKTYAGVSGFEGKLCYCTKDDCNGQTTVAPAIISSLVGLAMALYAII